MLDTLLDNPLATLFGLIGLTCIATWPLFRTRTTMLTVQLGISIGLGIHYLLLGATTAAIMQCLSFTQTSTAIFLGRYRSIRLVYLALIPVIASVMVLSWQGIPSGFAALSTLLMTLGRMQTNTVRLRLLLLAAGPSWFIHDWMVGSIPAMAADILGFGTGLTMLLRERRAALKATAWTAITRSGDPSGSR